MNNINTTEDHTPSTLIAMAIEKSIEVDKLEKLLELQERWEAKEAKKKFYDAMAKFQSEIGEIRKTKVVDYVTKDGGRKRYKYAPLSEIDEAIKKSLAKYGLTKSFYIKEENGRIYVSCKISHEAGHSEITTMSGVADASGNKNAIQASGSTITYLQRYTLIGALGLTTADEDNDGESRVEEGNKHSSNSNLNALKKEKPTGGVSNSFKKPEPPKNVNKSEIDSDLKKAISELEKADTLEKLKEVGQKFKEKFGKDKQFLEAGIRRKKEIEKLIKDNSSLIEDAEIVTPNEKLRAEIENADLESLDAMWDNTEIQEMIKADEKLHEFYAQRLEEEEKNEETK
jgi:hypothetical protein